MTMNTKCQTIRITNSYIRSYEDIYSLGTRKPDGAKNVIVNWDNLKENNPVGRSNNEIHDENVPTRVTSLICTCNFGESR